MYTSRIYNIYEDGKLVALTQKEGGAGQSHKQIIFRIPDQAATFALAFLADRHYHGMYDSWFVHDEKFGEKILPAYVPNAVAAMMAFPTAEKKRKQQSASAAANDRYKTTPPGASLAELPPKIEVVPEVP